MNNRRNTFIWCRSSKKANFNVNFCKRKRTLMSVSIMGVTLWSQLDVKTINSFKHIIKNMFISLYG